jgi:kanamycin kinase
VVDLRDNIPADDVEVPPLVTRLTAAPRAVWRNELGGLTFRDGDRFVKFNPRSTGIDLNVERKRLAWAAPYLTVPQVLDFAEDDTGQALVTRAIDAAGAVTDAWRARPRDAARAIGRGLRLLHDALPVAECPFTWSAEDRGGREVPPVEQLVVCHGDACAPNFLIDASGAPGGYVDLGSLGVADRWADLAVASMSLHWNFDPPCEEEFWDAYGIAPDPVRVPYYRDLWNAEDPPHPTH